MTEGGEYRYRPQAWQRPQLQVHVARPEECRFRGIADVVEADWPHARASGYQ